MSDWITVRFFLAGRCILESLEPCSPRVGDEFGIDGRCYRVERSIKHLPDCPPEVVHAHLRLTESEAIYPLNYPG